MSRQYIEEAWNLLKEENNKEICCICGEPIEGYGNNAEPVCTGICCDTCNSEKVIPARLMQLKKNKNVEPLKEWDEDDARMEAQEVAGAQLDELAREYFNQFKYSDEYYILMKDCIAEYLSENKKEVWEDFLKDYNSEFTEEDKKYIVDEFKDSKAFASSSLKDKFESDDCNDWAIDDESLEFIMKVLGNTFYYDFDSFPFMEKVIEGAEELVFENKDVQEDAYEYAREAFE